MVLAFHANKRPKHYGSVLGRETLRRERVGGYRQLMSKLLCRVAGVSRALLLMLIPYGDIVVQVHCRVDEVPIIFLSQRLHVVHFSINQLIESLEEKARCGVI
jgi:hypothetical protein